MIVVSLWYTACVRSLAFVAMEVCGVQWQWADVSVVCCFIPFRAVQCSAGPVPAHALRLCCRALPQGISYGSQGCCVTDDTYLLAVRMPYCWHCLVHLSPQNCLSLSFTYVVTVHTLHCLWVGQHALFSLCPLCDAP